MIPVRVLLKAKHFDRHINSTLCKTAEQWVDASRSLDMEEYTNKFSKMATEEGVKFIGMQTFPLGVKYRLDGFIFISQVRVMQDAMKCDLLY